MHRNILLRVSYLLQHAATHLLRTHFQRHIFHDRERYNQITSLERNKSSRCYDSARGDEGEWCNKMAADFEDL